MQPGLKIKTITESTCSETAQICSPALSDLGISFFDYARMYDDGTCYILSNNSSLISYLFDQQAPLFTPVERRLLKKNIYYLIPENGPYQEVMHDARQYFNVAHAIDLFQCHRGYIDVCCFASTPDNEGIINYYLNHIDTLENFMAYFKEAASGMVNAAYRERFMLPEHMRLNFDSRAVLDDENPVSRLTGRESAVTRLLLRGHTANEIGQALNRSRRTIEHHIENIKAKLGVRTRSELMAKLIDGLGAERK